MRQPGPAFPVRAVRLWSVRLWFVRLWFVRLWSRRRIRRSRATPFAAGAGIASTGQTALRFPGGSRAGRSRTLRARWGAHVRGPGGTPCTRRYSPAEPGGYVARMIVEVILKPQMHGPQGDAIAGGCHRLGFGRVLGVRQGKRFEVQLEGPADEAAVTAITKLARDLLSNPVIEEFTLPAGGPGFAISYESWPGRVSVALTGNHSNCEYGWHGAREGDP